MFLEKGVLKICSKFTGEHPCRSVISTKLLCNSIEITLWDRCSAVSLLIFSEHLFLRTSLEGCFWVFKTTHLTYLSIFSWLWDYLRNVIGETNVIVLGNLRFFCLVNKQLPKRYFGPYQTSMKEKSYLIMRHFTRFGTFMQFKKREKQPWSRVTFTERNFTKSNTSEWEYLTFFRLFKWYQIAQSITYIW